MLIEVSSEQSSDVSFTCIQIAAATGAVASLCCYTIVVAAVSCCCSSSCVGWLNLLMVHHSI